MSKPGTLKFWHPVDFSSFQIPVYFVKTHSQDLPSLTKMYDSKTDNQHTRVCSLPAGYFFYKKLSDNVSLMPDQTPILFVSFMKVRLSDASLALGRKKYP